MIIENRSLDLGNVKFTVDLSKNSDKDESMNGGGLRACGRPSWLKT